jgi:hypothetical protein
LVRSYCHRRTAADASRRETFQISPQFWHRQYVVTSGFFALVVIDDD